MRKQILSGFLAAVMAVSCLAVPAGNLTSGVISSSLVASADDDTEYTSGDYKYTVSNKKATITAYTGSATELTIPSKLGGYKVTEIGIAVFCGCTTLKKITFSDSLTSIGAFSFDGCTSLASVTISDSVKSIEESAFLRCTSLKSVTVPKSVKEIGSRAFGYKAESVDGPYKALKSFVLKGYSGSAAETYAKENGVVFKEVSTSKYVVPQVTNCYSAAASTSAIKISWNRIAGASGYRIYRYDTSKKKWVKVTTITNNSTTSYKFTGLKSDTIYKYKVKAYKKANGKTYWGNASETLKTATRQVKVTMNSSSKTTNAIRINWKKAANADGYIVQRYDPEDKCWSYLEWIEDGSILTYKDTGLKSGTVYKYRVCSYRIVDGISIYGAWSSTKKVTTKK